MIRKLTRALKLHQKEEGGHVQSELETQWGVLKRSVEEGSNRLWSPVRPTNHCSWPHKQWDWQGRCTIPLPCCQCHWSHLQMVKRMTPKPQNRNYTSTKIVIPLAEQSK